MLFLTEFRNRNKGIQMKLTPAKQRAYETWIKNGNWHTGGARNKRAFYEFVKEFALNRGTSGIESWELYEDIIARNESRHKSDWLHEDLLKERAEHYSKLFCELVEFKKYLERRHLSRV